MNFRAECIRGSSLDVHVSVYVFNNVVTLYMYIVSIEVKYLT